MSESHHIDTTLTMWCEKHMRPYKDRKLNIHAASHRLMERYFKRVAKEVEDEMPSDATGEELSQRFSEKLAASSEDSQVCCLFTEDDHDELLGVSIPSTGYEDTDIIEALKDNPNVREVGGTNV